MPHIQIDYSANLESVVNIADLCDKIRVVAVNIETFPVAGIRVRATYVDHVSMADGNPKHGFVDISVRLREGRTEEVKRDAITRIFTVLKDFMAPAMENHSIALSAEIRDISAEFSLKYGNVRNYLEAST